MTRSWPDDKQYHSAEYRKCDGTHLICQLTLMVWVGLASQSDWVIGWHRDHKVNQRVFKCLFFFQKCFRENTNIVYQPEVRTISLSISTGYPDFIIHNGMLLRFDDNGNGLIDYQEFLRSEDLPETFFLRVFFWDGNLRLWCVVRIYIWTILHVHVYIDIYVDTCLHVCVCMLKTYTGILDSQIIICIYIYIHVHRCSE